MLDVEPLNDTPPQQLLRIAASLEARSEHPLAQAILDYAAEAGIRPEKVSDFQALTGIAMGAAGSDVALETSRPATDGDDLARLPFAIRLSRTTLRVIRENISVALVLKAVFIVLAVPGYATLWMAVFADMGASLLVIANSLRLLRLRDR